MINVGQTVVVLDGRSGRILRSDTVKRVLKRYVELNDGSKWQHSGLRYPASKDRWDRSPCIVELTEKLQAQWDLERARRKCERELRQVLAILPAVNNKTALDNLGDALSTVLTVHGE